jgi:hypothetical protein
MYYRYKITFSAYILTPSEKWALNNLVLLLFSVVSCRIIFLARVAPVVVDVSERLFWLYIVMDDNSLWVGIRRVYGWSWSQILRFEGDSRTAIGLPLLLESVSSGSNKVFTYQHPAEPCVEG